MKQLFLLLLLQPLLSFGQDCDDYSHHTAVGFSYILPKGVSVEGAYFSKSGLTGGIGVAYSAPARAMVKSGENEYETVSNSFNIFAYAGYRVLQINYKFSVFLNAGGTMGDVNSLQPFVSTKFLFPAGQKAFSVEPFYIFNQGMSGRATLYLRF